MSYSKPALSRLAEADNYREFIQQLIKNYPKSFGGEGLTISAFSQKAGFQSRSFLSEVISGRKRLSKESLSKIVSASLLPGQYKTLLRLLAYHELEELRPKRWVGKDLRDELESARRLARQEVTSQKNRLETIERRVLFRIYASLGSIEAGSSLSEIVRRSRLGESLVLSCLGTLQRHQMVKIIDERYYATASEVQFDELGDHFSMEKLLEDLGSHLKSSAKPLLQDGENMFYFTVSSVDKKRLKEFNQKLKGLVLDLLDEYQDDLGDEVREVFVASYN